MTQFSLNVRYEVVNPQLAKAYVNDHYVGRVKCADDRVTFRCSDNPFKNLVPRYENYYALPMSEIIQHRALLESLTPVVIRNYLRNSGFLSTQPEPEPVDEVLIETQRIAA